MIDWKKPIRTVSGRAARLVGTFADPSHPYLVALKNGRGFEDLVRYTQAGKVNVNVTSGGHEDLENVPEPTTRFVNVYGNGHVGKGYESRDEADRYAETFKRARKGNREVARKCYVMKLEGTKLLSCVEHVKPADTEEDFE